MKKQLPDTKSVPYSELYSKFTVRKTLFIFSLIVVVVILALVAVRFGPVNIEMGEIFDALVIKIRETFGTMETPFKDLTYHRRFVYNAVWFSRLPRIVMAIIVGAGLATAGAVMQGVLRNPLVSPFTVGVSSGATLGASIAIILGFSFAGAGGYETYMIIVNAFIFALITSSLIILIGRLRGSTPESFLLVGIALMYFFNACTSFLHYIGLGEDGAIAAIVFWMMGSLNGMQWNYILVTSIVTAIGIPILMLLSWDLNAMTVGGDEVAISLGVNPGRVRVISMILIAIVTAATVCFTGIIGFVGLVAPHICRLIIGGDHRYLIPSSCVLGGLMVLAADTLARTIISPSVIPVGILLSFVGAPFFAYLLFKKRRQYWQ